MEAVGSIGLFTNNIAGDKFLSGKEIGIEAEYTFGLHPPAKAF